MAMLLSELLNRADVPPVVAGGLTSDSRAVRPGDVFIAYKGREFDGHEFVDEAARRGAVAICAERPPEKELSIPCVQVNDLADRRGELASKFYGYPGQEMHTIGVTGTNGKSSVAYGTASLLDSTACIGTLGWGMPPFLCSSSLTTVDPITMQRVMADLLKRGIRRAVVEVSSHALAQDRVGDLQISCGVFTNLTRDHLDYHSTMENYGRAKFRLFERPELHCGIVNIDDTFGKLIAEHLREQEIDCYTFGKSTMADLHWEDVDFVPNGIRGRWVSPWGSSRFSIPYRGPMYLSNAAAMLLVAVHCEMDFQEAVGRMHAAVQIPGRMEYVSKVGMPSIVLDYAHTPDALRAALEAVKSHTSGRVVCVFGCGGDRDQGKRPEMARVAQSLADYVVVTSDNPRFEDAMKIIEEVRDGFSGNAVHFEEQDRTKAIAHAIENAEKGDTVLVAGKGHERYQEIRGVRHPYSDRATIQTLMGMRG